MSKKKSNSKKVASKKPAANVNKVAGMYQPKSAMGQLFSVLKDQRPHQLASLKKAVRGVKVEHRLYWIGAQGKEKKAWGLTINKEKGTVQMKLTATGKKLAAPAKTAASKSA